MRAVRVYYKKELYGCWQSLTRNIPKAYGWNPEKKCLTVEAQHGLW